MGHGGRENNVEMPRYSCLKERGLEEGMAILISVKPDVFSQCVDKFLPVPCYDYCGGICCVGD